jgi:hypothetical protein
LNCEIVEIDKKLYQKENPPLGRDGRRTNVTVSVTVNAFGRLNEIEMTFQANFDVHLEW